MKEIFKDGKYKDLSRNSDVWYKITKMIGKGGFGGII
jgi:hypothetical protein